MTTLLSIATALIAGLLMSRVAKPLKLPAVTGYLVAGILVGPYCLGRLGIEGLGFTTNSAVTALGLISDVALGFIAFSIGNEFHDVGRTISWFNDEKPHEITVNGCTFTTASNIGITDTTYTLGVTREYWDIIKDN